MEAKSVGSDNDQDDPNPARVTTPGLLRQAEMQGLIDSEQDPITAHLMRMANDVVCFRVLRNERGPVADFDLQYFMEILQEFSSQHDTLKKILEGKGDELIWLPDFEKS